MRVLAVLTAVAWLVSVDARASTIQDPDHRFSLVLDTDGGAECNPDAAAMPCSARGVGLLGRLVEQRAQRLGMKALRAEALAFGTWWLTIEVFRGAPQPGPFCSWRAAARAPGLGHGDGWAPFPASGEGPGVRFRVRAPK